MKSKSEVRSRFTIEFAVVAAWVLGLAVLAFSAGCETAQAPNFPSGAAKPEHTEPLVLREGDVLKISFPGAPSLDTVQQIRSDGRISLLPDGFEMDVAGKTTAQLEKDLIDHYKSKLVSTEVSVSVESATFPIYVNGAVLKPGKVLADHPMTALEAIMESGGFDYSKANLKAVKVIREKPPGSYILNFKGLTDGNAPEPFYMKPFDIIYVPEKVQWF